jgi:hypothetical protein
MGDLLVFSNGEKINITSPPINKTTDIITPKRKNFAPSEYRTDIENP